MKKPITDFIESIESLAQKGARFASLLYTAKGTGETARHTVCLGVSVERAYKRDIVILEGIRPTLSGVALVACDELIASLRESLEKGIGNNSAYTCAGVYRSLCRGVKLHVEKSALHVSGFSIGKEVLIPGEYKTVKSNEKTIAKNALRKHLKSGRIRQFAVSELELVKMEGKKIVFE